MDKWKKYEKKMDKKRKMWIVDNFCALIHNRKMKDFSLLSIHKSKEKWCIFPKLSTGYAQIVDNSWISPAYYVEKMKKTDFMPKIMRIYLT